MMRIASDRFAESDRFVEHLIHDNFPVRLAAILQNHGKKLKLYFRKKAQSK